MKVSKKILLLVVPALILATAASLFMANRAYALCPASCQFPDAGRDYYHGYLTNSQPTGPGSNRGAVWPANSGLMDVHNGTQFVDWMQAQLFNTANGSVNRTAGGGTYVVTSMLGYKGPDFNNNFLNGVNTARNRFNDWRAMVLQYEANGWVNFDAFQVNCHPYVQGNMYYPANDVFFFDTGAFGSSGCEAEQEIIFTNPSTGNQYRLKKICGNPVQSNGSLVLENFTITGRTTVSSATALPGQTVTFRHYLRNEDDETRQTVWTTRDGLTNNAIVSNVSETLAPSTEKLVNTQNVLIPNNAVPGTRFCRYISFTPANQNGDTGQGTTVCVEVTADFSLQPTVIASSGTAQEGDSITFTYNVFNNGATSSPASPNCKVVGNNRPGGYAPLPQQDADRTSDPGFAAPATNCAAPFGAGSTTTVATETVTVGNDGPGSKICRSLVVNPKDQTGGPRASAEICVVIAKAPYVHFMGNDVWAGGGFLGEDCTNQADINTVARSLSDGSGAGSVVEYAGFALGNITEFGTASKALVNPAGVAGKLLTFSNSNASSLGNFGAPQHCIDDYLSKFTARTNEPSANVNVGTHAQGVFSVPGGTVFAGNMPAGSQQVYIVNGDAVINGNIQYPANYNGAGEIPSLVIIATGNITITGNVTQVDGVFVAKGQFITCDPPAGNLSVSICNAPLTVNGAVIARKLTLMRTGGADGNSPASQKQPAETFYFRPEVYLRSALTGIQSGVTVRTIEQRDLPPRY